MTKAAVIRRTTLDHLSRLDRAVAVLMQEDGLLTIIEDAGEQSFGTSGA